MHGCKIQSNTNFQVKLLKLSVGVIQQTPVLNVGPFPPCVMEIASGQMHWSNVLTKVSSAYRLQTKNKAVLF